MNAHLSLLTVQLQYLGNINYSVMTEVDVMMKSGKWLRWHSRMLSCSAGMNVVTVKLQSRRLFAPPVRKSFLENRKRYNAYCLTDYFVRHVSTGGNSCLVRILKYFCCKSSFCCFLSQSLHLDTHTVADLSPTLSHKPGKNLKVWGYSKQRVATVWDVHGTI